MSIYRERFAATMAHQPVDRPPIDLGACPQATIDDPALMRGLAAHLGFTGEAPADYRPFDRRILAHYDVDFRVCGGLVWFDTGQARVVSATERVDDFGMRYRFSGQYWERVDGPLASGSRDAVAAYRFPSLDQMRPGVLAQWAAEAEYLATQTPYVVVGEHPVFGVLELACWLCGYDTLLLMLLDDPETAHLLFDKILAFQRPIVDAYYAALGPYLHVTTSGDDFGTQQGPFMAPALFREYVKPRMAARIADTRRHTDAAYLHHSCGSIFPLIPDLIEIGVGILNPIQPVAGMDPAALKAAYGRDIVFHGGLDTQAVLPGGDAAEIAAAVDALLAAMTPTRDGGYIFAAAHNLQSDVAPAAVDAMFSRVTAPAR
jgi:uroporphyrinogen decarboxylase